jgi:hypothetical protein
MKDTKQLQMNMNSNQISSKKIEIYQNTNLEDKENFVRQKFRSNSL